MPAKKTPAKTMKKKTFAAARKPAANLKKSTVAPAKQSIAPKRNLHLGMHLIIAGSAVCVMLLLGVIERNTFATRESSAEEIPVTIGLEHSAPLSMSILFYFGNCDLGFICRTHFRFSFLEKLSI